MAALDVSGRRLGRAAAVWGVRAMDALELIRLGDLMRRTAGRPELLIGLIDGPVDGDHAHIAHERIREIPSSISGACARAGSTACLHGTFVAGILFARRRSAAPAICPDCTLLVRPIFTEATAGRGQMPTASPPELAAAIVDCIEAGARVINLSVALVQSSPNGDRALEGALNLAARRGAIVVAATGNHGTVGGSAVTTHACVIPVVACDLRGRAIGYSNLGTSIGRRGLCAPGDEITSLKAGGGLLMLSGTSAAAPFVTGAIALLWSQFPNATAAQVRYAVMQPSKPRRKTIVPPVLDALAAQQALSSWSN